MTALRFRLQDRVTIVWHISQFERVIMSPATVQLKFYSDNVVICNKNDRVSCYGGAHIVTLDQ
jgi:hypothetical protein